MAGKIADIVFPDSVRKWALFQTGAKPGDQAQKIYGECADVQGALKYLRSKRPKNVLEIGCGIGRVSVYLSKTLGNWKNAMFHMLDGHGGNRKACAAAGVGRMGCNYSNSLEATREFCAANGIGNLSVHEAGKATWGVPASLAVMAGEIDIAYSFKSVGFHWDIHAYLEALVELMKKGGIVIFETRNGKGKHWKFTKAQEEIADMFVDHEEFEWVERPSARKNVPLIVLKKR